MQEPKTRGNSRMKERGARVCTREYKVNLVSCKRSVSEVITTVLLIMLSVVAVSLLAAFLIPFVKDKLKEKECFDALGKLSIEEGDYTCYNNENTFVMVKIDSDFEIKGLVISLQKNDNSNTYRIFNGTEIDGVRMFDSSLKLRVPTKNKISETYNFSGTYDFVEIAPVLQDDKQCKSVSKKISIC